MALILVVAGLVLIALPGATRRAGRRLAPDEWARLCVWGLASGAAVLELGLALFALPTVLRAVGVPALASMCERALGVLLPSSALVGWIAASGGVAMPVLAVVGIYRARRTYSVVRAEPWLGEHRRVGGHDLVVLPTDQLLAVSVDGAVPQVIVSRGLLNTFSDGEVSLILRHEAAHLDHGHQRLLVLATAVDHGLACFPPARASTSALRVALERWADEEAAGDGVEDRERLAAALLGMTVSLTVRDLAAFSPADTIVERLDALRLPPARAGAIEHLLVYLPGTVAGAGVAVAVGMWADQALLALAGRCPT